jgi:hypothetical protein
VNFGDGRSGGEKEEEEEEEKVIFIYKNNIYPVVVFLFSSF